MIVSKSGVIKKMRKPNGRMLIIIAIIIVVIAAVVAGMYIFEGDDKVGLQDFRGNRFPSANC